MANRVAAVAALVLPPVVVILACVAAVRSFPEGLIPLTGTLIALAAVGYGLLRRGVARGLGMTIAAIALAGTVYALIVNDDRIAEAIAIGVGLLLAAAAARFAFTFPTALPRVAAAPKHPVLFYNPKSGGGKAEKFHLADEARKRGIESIELKRGTDLEQLVRGAVADGADALAMAGGDGSQAVVASVAAELDLPYSCIPAGTRNHFALDLGVDRDDVVGALDALGAGAGHRRVDLAEVNGKVFVNNVSLGVYAEAVQHEGYRESKLKTILDTLPDAVGPAGEGLDLRWAEPDGEKRSSAAVILVSNNPYRLGLVIGAGTRPSLDEGLLGIAVADAPGGPQRQPMREWSAAEFVVDSEGPIAAGIDGEAMKLDAPLSFRSRPAALQVLISADHPGASPSAHLPGWAGGDLSRAGRDRRRARRTGGLRGDGRDPTQTRLAGGCGLP